MKYITSTIFLFIYSSSFSQSDSLRKYSYCIFGVAWKGNQLDGTYSGSGYFIRDKERIFFITANHVLTGCENGKDTCTPTVKPDNHPSEMTIFLNSEKGIRKDNMLTIYIGHISATYPCRDIGLDPDLIAYELRYKPKDTLYSIEKFLNRRPPKNKGAISIWGYPGTSFRTDFGITIPPSSHLTFGKYSFFDNYKYKACGGVWAIDTIDYLIQPKDSVRTDLEGYSGSPAFIQDGKTKNWFFIGTFVGKAETDKYVFVKPKYLNRAMGKFD